jgi:pSer/pThr/pTyr-binding forkhead associated (FHA) protein
VTDPATLTGPATPPSSTADPVVPGPLAELAGALAAAGPAEVLVVGDGATVVPGRDPVLVGRAPELPGPDHRRVSRRHVGFQLVGGVLVATDMGSRNGTWLVRDGTRHPLPRHCVLRPGDRLETLDEVELATVRSA